MIDQPVADRMWPYRFCSNCGKLCPVVEQEVTHKQECMVCSFALLSSKAGKTVLLTQGEARLRNLPIVKRG